MARKSFKGGLDNLFEGTGIKKERSSANIQISEKEKHWLFEKNLRLEKELSFWRTGKLTPEIFQQKLLENNLIYNVKTNEITTK